MNRKDPLPECDILLASDLLYSIPLAEALAARCDEALNNGVGVIVASRPHSVGEEPFLDELARRGVKNSGFKVAHLPPIADDIWPLDKIDRTIGVRPDTEGIRILELHPSSSDSGAPNFELPKRSRRQVSLRARQALERIGNL